MADAVDSYGRFVTCSENFFFSGKRRGRKGGFADKAAIDDVGEWGHAADVDDGHAASLPETISPASDDDNESAGTSSSPAAADDPSVPPAVVGWQKASIKRVHSSEPGS